MTNKKSPNVYKSCPKRISLEKLKIVSPLQKLLKNVGDLGKIIVAKGFEKLPNLVTLLAAHIKPEVISAKRSIEAFLPELFPR